MEFLTPKQIQILEWIEQYLNQNHTMPSRREIALGLGLSSPATIQQHIEALEKKGFLKRGETRESRALNWTAKSKKMLSSIHLANAYSEGRGSPTATPFFRDDSESLSFEIPLMGTIAAGYPIEVYPEARPMTVPLELFVSAKQAQASKSDFYMLSVRGESMIDEGIFPNDLVILKKSTQAKTGDTVAALVNGEATLKKFVKVKASTRKDVQGREIQYSGVQLHPANPKFSVIQVASEDRFEIQGVLVGVIRRFGSQ